MREAFVCQIMMESKRVGRLPAESDGRHAKLTVFSSVGSLETEEMPSIHHEASGDSLPSEEHANSSCVFSIIIFFLTQNGASGAVSKLRFTDQVLA